MSLLSIDESSGQQAGTSELSSFSSSNLPTVFDNVLTAIDAANTNWIGTISGIAVSGYSSGNPTGTTFASFSGSVNDVGFVDSGGAAFNGTASGLFTTDGVAINLYTYSGNNNVLLGRRADDNSVVFAAYVETLKSDGTDANVAAGTDTGAVSAKLWLVQYQTLSHLDSGGNPVDMVSLQNLLNLSVNSLVTFDATNAPSGNNLFMLLGDGNPAAGEAGVVVTGLDPSVDTVNTSQGGGATTLGTDNQMVTPARGLWFSFVKLSQASVDYTVPNLTHAEATTASDIVYDKDLDVSSATFSVVQLQPPKAATMTLFAYEDTEGAQGAAYLADIKNTADNTAEQVNVYSVTISRMVKTGKTTVQHDYHFSQAGHDTDTGGITVDFSGKTAVIRGIVAGDSVTYLTADDSGNTVMHNRLLIDNTGTDANFNSGFDIGNFTINSGAVASSPISALDFYDDVPTADAVLTGNNVTLDETIGAKAGDTNAASDDITATNTDPFANAYGTPIGAVSGVDLVDTNNTTGNDSVGATSTLTLSITDANSGLYNLAGTQITLYLETNGVITGRTGGSTGTVYFAIKMDSAGLVSVAQYQPVSHPGTTNPDDSQSLTGKVAAVTTETDGDKDQATDSVDIGAAIRFEDDGPTVSAGTGTLPTLTTDDTNTPGATAGPTSFASAFNAVNFGTDGFKDSDHNGVQDSDAVTYALSLASTTGVDSLLKDSATGREIYLFSSGASTVTGRVANTSNAADSSGLLAFTITLDTLTANITLVQDRAIMHNDPLDPVESGTSAATLAAGAVTLNITATDGDGDQQSASRAIGGSFLFEDDGPSVAFGNIVGTGTVDPQTGYWGGIQAGKDTLGSFDIDLTGAQLITPSNTVAAGTTTTFSGPTLDTSGNYVFTGSLTGDFDNNSATAAQTVHFTLTAYLDGHYVLDLLEGFASSVSYSTTNGGLGAGGPDSVQTLYIPKPPATPQLTTVFFSTVWGATSTQIESVLGMNEQQLEAAHPSLLDTRGMNVSTSGIGVDNNLLQGYGAGSGVNTATPDGSGNTADESFVINPLSPVASMEVKIDNSVSGYGYSSGERLFYKVFYTVSGSTTLDATGFQLVDTNMGLKNQPGSFIITAPAGKTIDAVELLMTYGDVKIPEIIFSLPSESLADDVKLAFNATVVDKDGDTATDAFAANLYANELAGSTFDYVLTGVSSQPDAFNVDLMSALNKYQVNGFELGTDKLVLANDATATVQSINNSGTDAIVTIAETGGQTTTVTVTGVHLTNADIAFA